MSLPIQRKGKYIHCNKRIRNSTVYDHKRLAIRLKTLSHDEERRNSRIVFTYKNKDILHTQHWEDTNLHAFTLSKLLFPSCAGVHIHIEMPTT